MIDVTEGMLLARIKSEADGAARKSELLRIDGQHRRAVLFDNAELFWSDLGFAIAASMPLTKDQAFVANYLYKVMADDPRAWSGVTTKRGKRSAVTA